ncbi:antitoxin/toxin system zeta toxin, signal recognition particle GTPase [Pasteurellaceae bacterium RH1A]|nr:antitoxin/toxin system zeta toxin, signal recognition particle GTPase [Pasteurellaceae bacterium RH1A]
MVREVKPSPELVEERFEDTKFAFGLTSVVSPKAIIFSGISGSGKSTLIREFHKFAKNYFPIQADDYRRAHPKIHSFIERYGREEAHKKTGNFAHRFARALLAKATEEKLNVVYETTFNNIETANDLLTVLKEAGYQIIVIALPTNTELSIERNQQRFIDKLTLDGTLPRIVEKEVIIRMAENYQACIQQIKEDRDINLFEVSDSKVALSILKEVN